MLYFPTIFSIHLIDCLTFYLPLATLLRLKKLKTYCLYKRIFFNEN